VDGGRFLLNKSETLVAEQAFSKLTVLDCTQRIAGPYCTKLLADFGAEVIKIEPPEGDFARQMGPFPGDEAHPERSGTFFYLNTNKKSVTLNLDTVDGVAILKELVKGADALVEGLAPGAMARLGLDADTLRAITPRLVITSISAFGQTGPYRDYEATNLILSGLGGTMYTMRPGTRPNDRPVKAGGYQAEYSTGVLAFIATVAGLMSAGRSGSGMSVDVGAMECVASTLMGNLGEYSYLGLSRKTNPYPIHGYPQGDAVRCKDGWISLTPGIGGAPNIAFLIGQPELEDTPLLADPRARMADPEAFDGLISPWLAERNKWDIARQAQELRLAFTPVLSPRETVEDEQIKAREFFSEADHPVMGHVSYPGAPAKLSATPWKSGRAPLLGEHNEEIYGRLGYSRAKLEALHRSGIV
jgi:crotonobetainyl-CoA:carnitine CoA-transferase CaiB-like acyl-CoA transferase